MSDNSATLVGGSVRLHLEGDELRFVVSHMPGSSEHKRVPVGSIAAVRRLIRHEPVNAAELEAAIAEVEDLIMPVLRVLPSAEALEVSGQDLCVVIAAASPAARGQPVSIEAIENLFNRLADVAMGSPRGRLGAPYTSALALSLVVLREVMHHGSFRVAFAAVESDG